MQRALAMATALLCLVVGSCATAPGDGGATTAAVEEIAQSPRQWTGIAVMPDGRIFVNFPRWSDDVPVSVAEVRSDGTLQPFPSPEWNGDALPPARRFVCVQSVVADRDGYLWVLDSGNPLFRGVIPGAPKLLKFDIRHGWLLASASFDVPVIVTHSYLNDVRIDTTRQIAYLTDLGAGALVVTDVRSGHSRRLLDGHPSVMAEDIRYCRRVEIRAARRRSPRVIRATRRGGRTPARPRRTPRTAARRPGLRKLR